MATISFSCAIFLVALIICFPHPSAGVPLEELERAITVLRVRGRALFANAIVTSDLFFDLLSAGSSLLPIYFFVIWFRKQYLTHSNILYYSCFIIQVLLVLFLFVSKLVVYAL